MLAILQDNHGKEIYRCESSLVPAEMGRALYYFENCRLGPLWDKSADMVYPDRISYKTFYPHETHITNLHGYGRYLQCIFYREARKFKIT